LNTVSWAFLGDAFFELSVRRKIVGSGRTCVAERLHFDAVKYVKASSQALAIRGLIKQDVLTEEELEVVRKARNHKPKSMPKNADPMDYKLATAFEALLGWHYLDGRVDRAEELAELAMRTIDGSAG
jgi:ribonuclease-3 family protein